jgi:hypothetical protein
VPLEIVGLETVVPFTLKTAVLLPPPEIVNVKGKLIEPPELLKTVNVKSWVVAIL